MNQPAEPARAGALTHQFRTILALTMVVVASLGAIVADRIAQLEFQTSVTERRLTQGQMLELQYRQDWLDRGSKRAEFDRRRDEILAEAAGFASAAKQMRERNAGAPSAAADELEIRAQERFQLARLLRQFNTVLIQTDDKNLEDSLTAHAVRLLQPLGFPVSWRTGESVSQAPIWHRLIEELEDAHGKVPELAAAVLGFVFALFLLTMADLATARRNMALPAAGLACLVSVSCAVFVSVIEPALGWYMLAIPLGSIAFGIAAWQFGLFATEHGGSHHQDPPEVEIRGFAGTRITRREAGDSFSKWVIVLLAGTVVLSAWAGYGYTSASARLSGAAREGFAQQVEMTKLTTRPIAASLHVLDDVAALLQSRVECSARKQELALAIAGAAAIDAAATLPAEEAVACAALDAPRSATAAAIVDGPSGIDADPYFPFSYYVSTQNAGEDGPSRAFGRWDGYTQIAVFWGGKATSYLTILTLCAIALFLLGQSLGIGERRLGRFLVIAALAFDAVAIYAMISTGVRQSAEITGTVPAECRPAGVPETPVEIAAYYYAKGKAIEDSADTGADFKAAAGFMGCAVAARPSFALALFALATDRALAGSPQAGQNYWSMPDTATVAEVATHRGRAIDILLSNGYVAPSSPLNSYGASLWHLAIDNGRPSARAQSIDLPLDRSIAAYKASIDAQFRESDSDARWIRPKPVAGALLPYLNLGLAYLSKLDTQQAHAWFGKALKLGAGNDWDIITTFMTTLEVLAANCPHLYSAAECTRLGQEIVRTKEAFIAGTFDPPPLTSPASISNADGYVSPDIVRWSLAFRQFLPMRDRLSVVWYVSDALKRTAGPDEPDYGPWRALPSLGGPVNTQWLRDVEGSDLKYALASNLYGTGMHSCLGEGRYRAEFYLNGVLSVSREFTLGGGAMEAQRLRELNLALCRPASLQAWQDPEPDKNRPGSIKGLVTKGGAPAVFVATFYAPTKLAGDKEPSAYFLDRTLEYLNRRGVAVPTADRLAPVGSACQRRVVPGDVSHSEWVSAEGFVHVALAFTGPLTADQVCDVMISVHELNPETGSTD